MNTFRIEGTGSAPPFVLEAGIGGSDAAWHWLRARLAAHAPVFSSDRASLRAAAGGAAHDQALRPLLQQHLRLPAVLVGHSLGALYLLRYALLHPQDVRALVLIDPAPDDPMVYPGSPSRLWRALFSAATWLQATLLRTRQARAALGLARLPQSQLTQLQELGLPPDASQLLARRFTEADFLGNLAHEVGQTAALQAQVKRLAAAPGAVLPPILVISAGQHPPATGAIAAYYNAAAKRHAALARMSPKSEHRVIEDADHNSIVARRGHAETVGGMILEFCGGLES